MWMNVRPLPVLALIALCSIAGCARDECDYGEDHCEGTERLHCEETSCHTPDCAKHLQWSYEPCAVACVEQPSTEPFCAVSDEPDPRCGEHEQGSGSDQGYCDGAVAVACWFGFAKSHTDCRDSGNECAVDPWGSATCVVSATPDPRCDAVAQATAGRDLCDGSQLLSCAGSYVQSVRECPNACVSTRPGWAFCAASTEPDPRCEDDGEGPRPRPMCSDDTQGRCTEAFLVCPADQPVAVVGDAGARDASSSP